MTYSALRAAQTAATRDLGCILCDHYKEDNLDVTDERRVFIDRLLASMDPHWKDQATLLKQVCLYVPQGDLECVRAYVCVCVMCVCVCVCVCVCDVHVCVCVRVSISCSPSPYALTACSWALKVRGEPDTAFHLLAAQAYWRSGDGDGAGRNYLLAHEPEEYAEMLKEWSDMGFAGERDLFLARAVMRCVGVGSQRLPRPAYHRRCRMQVAGQGLLG